MDIIDKISQNFIEDNFLYGGWTNETLISKIRTKLYDFDSKISKIKFLSKFIDIANQKYQDHYLVCADKEDCETNFEFESLIYYMQQDLERLGVVINDDTFTTDEIKDSEAILEEVLEKIEELKIGQEIIYDDLVKEIEELKNLYFLGKKNWRQLLFGKLTEMTVGGIISETASKQIIAGFAKLPNLLNQ